MAYPGLDGEAVGKEKGMNFDSNSGISELHPPGEDFHIPIIQCIL